MRVMKDTKIGKRFAITYGCSLAFLVVVAIMALVSMAKMNTQLDQIVKVSNAKVKAANEMKAWTISVIMACETQLLTRDKAVLERERGLVAAGREAYKKTLVELKNLETTDEGKKMIENTEAAIAAAREIDNKSMELADAGKAAEAAALFTQNARPAILKLEDDTRALIAYNDERTMLRYQEAQGTYSFFSILFIVTALVAVGLTLFLGILTQRSITVPMASSAAHMEHMAKGDFSIPVSEDALNRKDEMGLFARSMAATNSGLQKMLKEIADGANTVSTSSTELSAISKQMSAGAEQTSMKANGVAKAVEEMSTNMNSVAAATEQASTNIGIVAASTEEMTSTIGEIAMNSEKARSITAGAVDQANQATVKISELGRAARDIGKVTETISSISAQTNLLALNATIEAARAGAAGKGFAVVANEIKELAQQTASATEDIKNRIETIQSSTSVTVTDIEKVSHVIQEVSEIVATMAAAIEEQSVVTKDIANNVSQAARGTQEVNQRVSQTSSVAMTVAQDVAEVNQASGEISSSSAQVLLSSEELSRLAEQLKSLTSQFKV
jgi:methyl-accepting chemotaxis protein